MSSPQNRMGRIYGVKPVLRLAEAICLVHVPHGSLHGLVQNGGILQVGPHQLEGGGVVEAVADALVRHGGDVDILPLRHGAVGVQLVPPVLGPEGRMCR